ncbi:hypothetical protein MYSTI_03295 [Myxococcus stipitatus DSM 14675]|uniref:Uncharacterized protein n=1 Tax=Myxococcus stipitatus (strain DSM 14675 / JCM 12634 / Mx s8) TaxID=1278073 RepID=L7UAH1_MYXSD|nr:hypothetical protein [Myxococcus stipitatus]AGC44607.1 hypothetical protein MYSTI_03295 [Myxococcus stipitatus DSM 14675]
MEIYRSQKSKAKAEKPHEFYYSKNKLIAGTVLWSVVSMGAIALSVVAISKSNAGWLAAAIAATMVWMLIGCIRGLTNLNTPVLVIGADGILFPDGVLIAWEDIEENTYLSQSYMGIPTGRFISVTTRLKKPKRKALRVFALDMTSDEYLEICDRYIQRHYGDEE